MIIYLTTNLITGKQYVGRDKNNNPKYLGSGLHLKRAINKYGKENFSKQIVACCSDFETLCLLEEYHIQLFKTMHPKGYNHTPKSVGREKGCIVSEETKKKMSISHKRYWSKQPQKDRKPAKKKKDGLSEEHKHRISLAMKGKNTGKQSWSKGLTKQTDSRVAAMGIASSIARQKL